MDRLESRERELEFRFHRSLSVKEMKGFYSSQSEPYKNAIKDEC